MSRPNTRLSSDRITISLARGQKLALEEIAEKNQATLSFIARIAIEEFVSRHTERQLPLDFRIETNSVPAND